MMEAAVLPSRNCRRLWTFCCKVLRKSRLKSRGICISARHRQCPFKSDMLHTSPESIGPEMQLRSSAADIFTTQPEVPISRPEVSNISDAIPFRNMPGPKGIRNLPVVGNRFHFEPYSKHRMESVVDMRREYMETYGKVYREVLGLGWAVHIHDPLDVATMFRVEGKYPQRGFPSIFQVYDKRENGQVGLGSLIGEEWWRMRKAVQQKLVRPQHMRNFVSRMDQVAQDFIRRIEQVADGQGNVHNMRDELQKFAVEEISAVLFNHRFGCMEGELDPDSEADQLIRATDELFKEFALSTRVFPWFMIFRSPLYQRFRKAGNTIHSIGWKYMLKTMEIAMEKQNLGSDADEEADFITSLLQDKNLSLDYVTTIAMDMFRGAVESTSNTLTFFLHTIARNPEKQERLYAEIDRKLPNKTPVTSGALDHMPYLKACWKESFRLIFPLPAGAPRLLTQDAVMGGYHVPKGTPVFPENAVMCRMEEYFERADEYIPERWLREEESSLYRSPLSQYILVPFGHGVRNCLGRRFAEQNVQVAAIKLLQNFRVECDTEKINVVAQIFQTTDTPLTIRFIPRTGSGNYR